MQRANAPGRPQDPPCRVGVRPPFTRTLDHLTPRPAAGDSDSKGLGGAWKLHLQQHPRCFCRWWLVGFIWRNAFLGQTLSFAPEKKEPARGKALTGCPSVRGAESGPAARRLPPSTAARAGADPPNGYRAPGFPGPHSRGQSESPRWQVGYEFPAAAVANYHKLGVLKTIEMYSPTVLEARSPKSAGPRSLQRLWEDFPSPLSFSFWLLPELLGLQLYLPSLSRAFFPGASGPPPLCSVSASSPLIKASVLLDLGPTLLRHDLILT